jgi:hypothetical protein
MHHTRIALLAATALLAAAPLAAQTPIRPGETVTGALDESDPQMDHGPYYDSYVIRGRPGERVVISMRSDDFDTYLRWGGEAEGDWVEVETDDDGGEGTNSRLVVTLGAAGEYELRASAFSESGLGAYELSVAGAEQVVPGRIRAGQTISGELTDDDPEGESGPEDHYIVRGSAGEAVTAYLESDDFDTYLSFGGWEDDQLYPLAEDDDSGDGTNSALVGEFSGEASEHRIVVRSFSGGGRGAYTLRLVSGAETIFSEEDYYSTTDTVVAMDTTGYWATDSVLVTTDTTTVSYDERPAVWVGTPAEGTLGEGGGRSADGKLYYDYEFYASEGDRFLVDLSSMEFDPVVMIGLGRGDSFRSLETDDDSGPGNSAQARFTAPQYGQYVVRVTSARRNQRGEYLLLVRNDND